MSVAERARTLRESSFELALEPVLPIVLAIAAIACLAGICRAAAIVPLHVSLDPNEGWNAYHAAAAMAGHGLYPGPADLMVNNYPPLSFYLVGALGTLLGDQIVAGRIVSLVSFLILCALQATISRSLGTSRRAATFSVLLLAGILLFASDYVGMDDPQLLGHVFQLAGTVLLLREPRTRARMFAAALLFVAGGFVKHNLFALPFAALLWLAAFDRTNAKRLAFFGVTSVVAGLVAFRAAVGFDLVARLNSARAWSLSELWSNFANWLPLAAVPFCGLGLRALWHLKDPRTSFVVIYVGIAVAAGTLLSGGAGVDVNAMFDADIALALAAGLALDALSMQGRASLRIAAPVFAIACFLPLPVLAAADTDWRESAFWVHPLHEDAMAGARDIVFLRGHRGPAICESLAWCYWAGKSAPVDVFNLDQQLRSGTRNPAALVSLLRSRRFAVIELDETNPFPLPPPIESATIRSYRVDHTDDEGSFFRPR